MSRSGLPYSMALVRTVNGLPQISHLPSLLHPPPPPPPRKKGHTEWTTWLYAVGGKNHEDIAISSWVANPTLLGGQPYAPGWSTLRDMQLTDMHFLINNANKQLQTLYPKSEMCREMKLQLDSALQQDQAAESRLQSPGCRVP